MKALIFLLLGFMPICLSAQLRYIQVFLNSCELKFPDKPVYSIAPGKKEFIKYIASFKESDIEYVVEVVEFLKDQPRIRPQDLSFYYLGNVTSTVGNVKAGRLWSQGEKTMDGLKAIELDFSDKDNIDKRTTRRFIFFDKKLFAISVGQYTACR